MREHRQFILPRKWWSTDGVHDRIDLLLAARLVRRIGVRAWDGLLYTRDSITNPRLNVLHGTQSGDEILAILRLYKTRKAFEAENA